MSQYTSVALPFTGLMLCLLALLAAWHRDLAKAGPKGLEMLEQKRNAYNNIPFFTIRRRPELSLAMTSTTMLIVALIFLKPDTVDYLVCVACFFMMVSCSLIAEYIVDMAIANNQVREDTN